MSRRKYKMADYPIYHKAFDAAKSQSLKNPESNSFGMERGLLANRAGCESLQRILAEKVKARTNKVADIEHQFRSHQETCRREGRTVPAKMEMVSTTFEQWLVATAKLDVTLEEQDLVEERLKAIAEAEQRASDEAMLQYGPIGIGKLKEGVLAVIDGQNVGIGDDGVLQIMDCRSPYKQMAVSDYKQFVILPYKNARAQQHQNQVDDLIKQQREHPGLVLRNPPDLRIRKINKSKLPAWPENVPRPAIQIDGVSKGKRQ